MKIQAGRRQLSGIVTKLSWLVLAILAMATFLRLYHLAKECLWLDEAYQVQTSSKNLTSILQTTIHQDTHPPLYYFIQHFWMLLFGQCEAAVRSLSACMGIFSLLLVYLVGRELFDRKTGLITSFLLATSLFEISPSQEGRPYSLLMFLTLLSFLFFIKIIPNGKTNEDTTCLL
jgi:mannosyltransferase